MLKADLICDFIMERFANFLNSYTKAFNKTYVRKGALFIDYLKREEVEGALAFLETAVYIHQDPMRHGYCKQLNEWQWTSLNFDYFGSRAQVVEKFGGEIQFQEWHQRPTTKNRSSIMEIN
jgi:putative transposase